jgi:hypothetical protein
LALIKRSSFPCRVIAVALPEGHAYEYWKAPNGKLWIDDLLKEAGIENYRLSLLGGNKKMGIEDYLSCISSYAGYLLKKLEEFQLSSATVCLQLT